MTPPAALKLRSISLREANRYLVAFDPRQGSIRSHTFAVALDDDHGVVRAVAIAGRPTDPQLDTGYRLEILRAASDGTPDAASLLYRCTAEAGAAIGYRLADILTHTPATDAGTGIALHAAGWVPVAAYPGSTTHQPGPEDEVKGPVQGLRVRWHAAPPATAARCGCTP